MAMLEQAVTNQKRFDRRSKSYRFKLWALTHPSASPADIRDVASRLGVQGWSAMHNDLCQTRQVLRDLGITLPSGRTIR